LEDLSLFSAAHSAARSLVISRVKLVDDIHSLDHSAYGRETIRIQSRVFTEINVQLGSPRVGTRHRICDRPASVALSHRIILECIVPPHGGDRRIARDPELHDESGSNAIETRVVKEACANQIVESVYSARSPLPMTLNDE